MPMIRDFDVVVVFVGLYNPVTVAFVRFGGW